MWSYICLFCNIHRWNLFELSYEESRKKISDGDIHFSTLISSSFYVRLILKLARHIWILLNKQSRLKRKDNGRISVAFVGAKNWTLNEEDMRPLLLPIQLRKLSFIGFYIIYFFEKIYYK